jgi:TRAP-type mannitol/chloroaromatic compound transport system permease small subunit
MAADAELNAAEAAERPAPQARTRLLAFADTLAIAGSWFAAASLAVLVVLIVTEILVAFVSKFFPDLPGDVPIAWEYSGYLSGTAFMAATAIALRAGNHIRVGIVINNLSGAVRRGMELLCSLVGTVMAVFLAWTLTRFAIQAAMSGQVSIDSYTPMWIPKSMLAVGAILLAVQMVARLIRGVAGAPLEDESLKATGVVE